MSDRRIKVKRLATTTPDRFIDVEVYHNKGGENWFTGGIERAGYWLSISPLTVGNGFETFTSGQGSKLFLEEALRFNGKKLAAHAATITAHPKYQDILRHVSAKQNLTLSDAA